MYGKVIAKSPLVALFHRNGLFKATPNPQTLQISGWASANRVSLRSQLVNLSEHGFSTFFQNDDILISYLKSLSPCRPLPPLPLFGRRLPGKGPSEGRGVLVQDQQDPSAQLDGTIEGRLPWVVANLILQLMLVVGVGAHPVGCLIRQLAQRSVPLQARHELAHRLHLMSKQFGAVEQTNYPTCFVPLECNEF